MRTNEPRPLGSGATADRAWVSSFRGKMSEPGLPPGWDEARVQRLIDHYENMSDDEMIAEDEAARRRERMIAKNTLCLGDLRFQVDPERVAFHALISNATNFRLFWMISIPCKRREVVVNGETDYWRPSVYWESIENKVKDWKRLEGQEFVARGMRGMVHRCIFTPMKILTFAGLNLVRVRECGLK